VLSACCDAPEWRRSVGAEPYIETVFENELVELDTAATLAAAEANEHALITAEVRRLHIAAQWADLNAGDAVTASRLPGPNARSGWAGRAPRPSPPSHPLSWVVCYACPMAQPRS